MSDRGFRVYPSGFALRDDGLTQASIVEGDLMVTELFEAHRRGDHTVLEFDHFSKVVKQALKLMGSDANWIITQSFNPNLSKQKLSFLVDTIIFIETGRRSQSMTTWRAVCCDDEVKAVKGITLNGFSINKDIVLPKSLFFSQPASIISTWLSRDGGFGDLIESMYLMFGAPVGDKR